MAAESQPTPDALARRFSGWRFWWSHNDQGEQAVLNATRRRHLTDAELNNGLAQTLPYGHGSDLVNQLEQQERLQPGHTP